LTMCVKRLFHIDISAENALDNKMWSS
jgi:hypothetical protein